MRTVFQDPRCTLLDDGRDGRIGRIERHAKTRLYRLHFGAFWAKQLHPEPRRVIQCYERGDAVVCIRRESREHWKCGTSSEGSESSSSLPLCPLSRLFLHMDKSHRGANYEKIKANRLAFHPSSKNSDDPPSFSWLVEGKLAGMSLPTSTEQLKTLKRSYNVGLVCSLIEEPSCPPESMFQVSESSPDIRPESLHIDWRDMSTPTRQQIDELVTVTHSYIEKGIAVVYHCFAGKGRTGTGLACYLLRYHADRFDADSAIQHIRDLRPGSIETSSQELFVKNYERTMKGEPLIAEPTGEDKPSWFTVRLRKVTPESSNIP